MKNKILTIQQKRHITTENDPYFKPLNGETQKTLIHIGSIEKYSFFNIVSPKRSFFESER